MRLAKKFFHFLPPSAQHSLIQSQMDFQPLYDGKLDVEVKLATTHEELKAAYQLLHDAYLGKGLMNPDPSGMRVNVYSALPFTSTVIAKLGGKVVATVSLIKDSPVGFPSDKEYLRENDEFRNKGFSLVEVSALAVDKNHRRSAHSAMLSLLLMRYLYDYVSRYQGGDMLVATIHPSALVFYEALFGFVKNGVVTKYSFVKKALAIHISLNMKSDAIPHVVNISKGKPSSRNLEEFFLKRQFPFLYFPKRVKDLLQDPVMTPELLNQLFVKESSLFRDLPADQLSFIKSAYSLYFPLESLSAFKQIKSDSRDFRYLSRLPVVLVGSQMIYGHALDISLSGLFFSPDSSFFNLPGLRSEEKVRLIFNLFGAPVEVTARVVIHKSQHKRRLGQGFGLAFLQTPMELIHFLRSHHLNLDSPKLDVENVIPLFSRSGAKAS